MAVMRSLGTAILIMTLLLALGWLFLPNYTPAGLFMPAQGGDQPNWGQGIAGLIVLVVGAVGAWLINWAKTKTDNKIKEDETAFGQLRDYADRLEKRIDRLETAERECLKLYGDAKEKIAKQDATIERLTNDIRFLQEKLGDATIKKGATP